MSTQDYTEPVRIVAEPGTPAETRELAARIAIREMRIAQARGRTADAAYEAAMSGLSDRYDVDTYFGDPDETHYRAGQAALDRFLAHRAEGLDDDHAEAAATDDIRQNATLGDSVTNPAGYEFDTWSEHESFADTAHTWDGNTGTTAAAILSEVDPAEAAATREAIRLLGPHFSPAELGGVGVSREQFSRMSRYEWARGHVNDTAPPTVDGPADPWRPASAESYGTTRPGPVVRAQQTVPTEGHEPGVREAIKTYNWQRHTGASHVSAWNAAVDAVEAFASNEHYDADYAAGIAALRDVLGGRDGLPTQPPDADAAGQGRQPSRSVDSRPGGGVTPEPDVSSSTGWIRPGDPAARLIDGTDPGQMSTIALRDALGAFHAADTDSGVRDAARSAATDAAVRELARRDNEQWHRVRVVYPDGSAAFDSVQGYDRETALAEARSLYITHDVTPAQRIEYTGPLSPPPLAIPNIARPCGHDGCGGVLTPTGPAHSVDEGDGTAMVDLSCSDCTIQSSHSWELTDAEYHAQFGHTVDDQVGSDDPDYDTGDPDCAPESAAGPGVVSRQDVDDAYDRAVEAARDIDAHIYPNDVALARASTATEDYNRLTAAHNAQLADPQPNEPTAPTRQAQQQEVAGRDAQRAATDPVLQRAESEHAIRSEHTEPATTAHLAQGRTVDTAQAYLASTPESEATYVGATRGDPSGDSSCDELSDEDAVARADAAMRRAEQSLAEADAALGEFRQRTDYEPAHDVHRAADEAEAAEPVAESVAESVAEVGQAADCEAAL